MGYGTKVQATLKLRPEFDSYNIIMMTIVQSMYLRKIHLRVPPFVLCQIVFT